MSFNTEKQEYTTAFFELLLSVMTAGGSNMDISAPRLTLIGTTKLKIDELQPQQEGVRFIDTSTSTNILDMYINGLLDESAKHVLQTAPTHIITPTDGFGAVVKPMSGEDFGHIILPEDYIRWVELKMQGWSQGVTSPILTTNPRYKRQKYSATRGKVMKPVAVLNSAVKINEEAKKQVDVMTLTGDGEAIISCAGLSMTAQGSTTSEVVTVFLAEYDDALLEKGVVLTGDDAEGTLTFTAAVAGVGFISPWIATTDGDLTGTVEQTQENVAASEPVRVVEYYSVPVGGAHVISKFLYIGLVGAEHIQSNLTDALTWMCASKVLQIMGNITGQGGAAEKAIEQATLSYQNLL